MTANDSSNVDSFNGQFFVPSTPVKSIILMGPGLNLNPLKMLPLALGLLERGHAICLINLAQKTKKSLILHWEETTLDLLKKLPKECKGRPLITLGFSLSALHFLDLADKELIKPKLMISLAPPLSINKVLLPIKYIAKLPFNMKLLSFNYSDYRYRHFTTVNEYKALIELKEKGFSQSKIVKNIPHHVYISNKDELINSKNIKELVLKNKNWKLKEVTRDKEIKLALHHLIIDETCLGQKAFNEILDGIATSIENGPSYRNKEVTNSVA